MDSLIQIIFFSNLAAKFHRLHPKRDELILQVANSCVVHIACLEQQFRNRNLKFQLVEGASTCPPLRSLDTYTIEMVRKITSAISVNGIATCYQLSGAVLESVISDIKKTNRDIIFDIVSSKFD